MVCYPFTPDHTFLFIRDETVSRMAVPFNGPLFNGTIKGRAADLNLVVVVQRGGCSQVT